MRGRSAVLGAIAAAVGMVGCASAPQVPGDASPSASDFRAERPPTLVSREPFPAYPGSVADTATRRPLPTGRVSVLVFVRIDGTVDPDSIRIRSTTHEAFNAPVMVAVSQWRFLPGEIAPGHNGRIGRFARAAMWLPMTVEVLPPAGR